MLEHAQYTLKVGISIPAKILFYHNFSMSKKDCPDGSGPESMLSAVNKRDICSHVTGLRIKIIILHKF